jgi:DNA-binding response OmpR family regulator
VQRARSALARRVLSVVALLGPVHILVAEDDPDLREAVSAALERLGADVVQARSGAELIEQLADRKPFDLVVTDISMPWMTGLQAMFSARTAGVGMPVLVMTALEDEAIPDKVLALGDNALLLHKPFELRELEVAAETLLSRQPGAAGTSSDPGGTTQHG